MFRRTRRLHIARLRNVVACYVVFTVAVSLVTGITVARMLEVMLPKVPTYGKAPVRVP